LPNAAYKPLASLSNISFWVNFRLRGAGGQDEELPPAIYNMKIFKSILI